ncbi:MAG TPA: spore germination protein [Firmicutes bacterium]|nr:spore germination protein [Bacillota bacterium]
MTEPIPSQSLEFRRLIEDALNDPYDLEFESPVDGKISIAFLTSFANKKDIQANFLAPLGRLLAEKRNYTWKDILPVISEQGRKIRESLDEAVNDLLEGYTLVHLAGSHFIYTFDTHERVKREPTAPLIERTIHGPKLSLLEDIKQNILLIRERIKNRQLKIEGIKIGARSRTKVAAIYLQDVASPLVVQKVHERLGKISIDGIVDSGYIEQYISDNPLSLFPLTQSTERPDKLIAAVLEGRIVILVDGSSNGIIVPVTVNELYQSSEDYYFPFWFGVFLRAFRIIGNVIAVLLPSVYVALFAVNASLLPIRMALTVSGGRIGVAFPLVVELLFMEFVVELFREGSLRLPTTVSQTLGVASGVILGLAAVNAGMVSNATLVVTIITAIASYSGPNYEIGLSWRILRFSLILIAAAFGLYGLTIGGLVILGHAAIQDSFGISFLSPWAPILPKELIDTIFRRPLWMRRRLQIYQPVDEYRAAKKGGKKDE